MNGSNTKSLHHKRFSGLEKRILFEDNHLIAINKNSGELVQGDKTGDKPLLELLKEFIKERDAKPGQVFLEAIHRLDRPVSGVVLFAKTSKALSRMSKLFHDDNVVKKYWAIVGDMPLESEKTLVHHLVRNQSKNKSFAYDKPKQGSKEARLTYRLLGSTSKYFLLEVQLHTGRHHQIRAQLTREGLTIRGDLKYGAPRSNPDGSISLHAISVSFEHPVTHNTIQIEGLPPRDSLWDACVHLTKQRK